MIRSSIVQLAVMILALILGFLTLQYLLSSIVSIGIELLHGNSFGQGVFAPSLTIILASFLQAIVCWLLIKKSGDIADFICDKANFVASFKIISRPADLLFILLIVIGIYLLISNLSPLIQGILAEFRNKAPHSSFNQPLLFRPSQWFTILLELVLPILLLMFAKPIAVYFAKDLSEAEIVIEEQHSSNDLLD